MRSRRVRSGSPSAGCLGGPARALPAARRPAGGLDLDREVPGGLWEWVCGSDGQWLGVVTVHIPYRDDRSDRFIADRQLVPARALRPR